MIVPTEKKNYSLYQMLLTWLQLMGCNRVAKHIRCPPTIRFYIGETRLEAVIFYIERFVPIEKLLVKFNAEDSTAIAKAQSFVGKSTNFYQNASQFCRKNDK